VVEPPKQPVAKSDLPTNKRSNEGNKMTKAQKISEMILHELAVTGSISQAFDRVFGEGSYDKLASDVYHALRVETK
jgi:hypothetical protein